METPKHIITPLTDDVIDTISCGDMIMISGTIYTGRDAAHARLVTALDNGRRLPVDLKDQIIYYAGPTPARPGRVIGSCGPTTSGRMDTFTPRLLDETGLKGMIGKGPRNTATIEAMIEHHCVYFAAVGGAAALIASSVRSCEIVAYDDLGPEAIRRLEVVDYPCVCVIDAEGNDLYTKGPSLYRTTP